MAFFSSTSCGLGPPGCASRTGAWEVRRAFATGDALPGKASAARSAATGGAAVARFTAAGAVVANGNETAPMEIVASRTMTSMAPDTTILRDDITASLE